MSQNFLFLSQMAEDSLQGPELSPAPTSPLPGLPPYCYFPSPVGLASIILPHTLCWGHHMRSHNRQTDRQTVKVRFTESVSSSLLKLVWPEPGEGLRWFNWFVGLQLFVLIVWLNHSCLEQVWGGAWWAKGSETKTRAGGLGWHEFW